MEVNLAWSIPVSVSWPLNRWLFFILAQFDGRSSSAWESCENIVSLCSMSTSHRNILLLCCFSLWFCCTFCVGLFSLLIVSFLGGLYIYISSKHAGSDPDRLGSIGQKRARWFLLTGLLPDRIRLAKTWHRQPELTRIRAAFAQYDPGCLWTIANVSESGKLVAAN